jgi:hypothetical protein
MSTVYEYSVIVQCVSTVYEHVYEYSVYDMSTVCEYSV